MSVTFGTGSKSVKKKSYLVARIVSFHTANLHLVTFRILKTYLSNHIELGIGHVISHE